MSVSPMLVFHISCGVIGLLSGAVAMIFRKGSRGHVLSGRVFVVAMVGSQPPNPNRTLRRAFASTTEGMYAAVRRCEALSTGFERTSLLALRLRLFLPLLSIRATLTCPARLRSSTRCCPPNISSITIGHDEVCELPFLEGSGSLINKPVTLRTIPRFWHSRTSITAFLLYLSTTRELVVLNLIPQRESHPDSEFARRGHPGLPQTLLNQFAAAKTLHSGSQRTACAPAFARPKSPSPSTGMFVRDRPHNEPEPCGPRIVLDRPGTRRSPTP